MSHTLPVAMAGGGSLAAILTALFAAGLVGSFSHCIAMCSPFVLAQTREGTGNALARLSQGLLLPYHLGRLTTYSLLGALAGAVGQDIVVLTRWHWLLPLFLAGAALLFLIRGLSALLPGRSHAGAVIFGRGAGNLLAKLAGPLFAAPGPARGYLLGIVLGLLPCGFLYAALAAAAGSGSALHGALAMAAFATATVPALVIVSVAGTTVLRNWRSRAVTLTVPIQLFNAALLAFAAFRMIG